MTIAEANAANEIAREVLKLAGEGVKITPELEHGVAILLINAHKALNAGFDERAFYQALSLEQKKVLPFPPSDQMLLDWWADEANQERWGLLRKEESGRFFWEYELGNVLYASKREALAKAWRAGQKSKKSGGGH